jgi:hypothetical protein
MPLFLATVALSFFARSAPVPSGSSVSRTPIDLLVSVPLLAFPLVGALIASRRPRNPIGWICLADGLLLILLGLFDYYSVYGLANSGRRAIHSTPPSTAASPPHRVESQDDTITPSHRLDSADLPFLGKHAASS